MKDFDTRTYSINDFVEWDKRGKEHLQLSPKFQRRPVWTAQAKSYLIDTILKGRPLPVIFIRATTNPKTKVTTREVVDGQQRLRTILSYVKDGFKVSKVHHAEFGGLYFSELPDDVQTDFLKYELAVNLLLDLSDSDILEIFARLNSYSVSLNKQELFNAQYFGYFKQTVYNLSSEFYSFWITNEIFTDTKIMRMAEAEMITDILVVMVDGIQSKKSVERYYKKYDEDFPQKDIFIERFRIIMDIIGNLLCDNIKSTKYSSPPVFYGLFVSLYHLLFKVKDINLPIYRIEERDYPKITNALLDINNILTTEPVPNEFQSFVNSVNKATTDSPSRVTRCNFIIKFLLDVLGC